LKNTLVGLSTDSQTTLTAVLAIEVLGHEDTSTASFTGAFLIKTGNLTVIVDTVVFKDRKGDLLALMLNLLGSGVSLLLLLFGTTTETENQMESRFLLDVVVGESTAIFKLLTSKNQALLIRGNSYKFKEKNRNKQS